MEQVHNTAKFMPKSNVRTYLCTCATCHWTGGLGMHFAEYGGHGVMPKFSENSQVTPIHVDCLEVTIQKFDTPSKRRQGREINGDYEQVLASTQASPLNGEDIEAFLPDDFYGWKTTQNCLESALYLVPDFAKPKRTKPKKETDVPPRKEERSLEKLT